MEQQCKEAEEAYKINRMQEVYNKIKLLSGKFELKVTSIKDANGKVLEDDASIQKRWKEHFEQLLNVDTHNDPTVLTELSANNTEEQMPTFLQEEVRDAISKMKKDKAPGMDGITTELLQGGGETVVNAMHTLVTKIHQEGEIPEDWAKSTIVPIYKRKGDPQDCKNYRGISLQSIPGKVFTKMIQNRMKQYVERALGEEQAGFRPGRSTIDQLFTMRQILEKSIEHNQKVFINFIDFKQAFDSIWHDGMWRVMQNAGIPEQLIKLVKEIYRKSSSAIKVDRKITEYFHTKTGVRQGCILSPYLFNLVLEAVMSLSLSNTEAGIKLNGGLVNNLRFADDIGLLTRSETELQDITTQIDETSRRFGLMINAEKTKTMVIEKTKETPIAITIQGEAIEQVEQFVYLGGQINADGSNEKDIQRRIGRASQAFGMMNKIWRSRELTKKTKIKIYETMIQPIFLYGSECWTMRKQDERRILTAEMSWLRRIAGISRLQKLRNDDIRQSLDIQTTLLDKVVQRRLRWFGHVERMPVDRIPHNALHARFEGKRHKGRPRLRWIDNITEDITTLGLTLRGAIDMTKDRGRWRSFTRTHRRQVAGVRN